MDGSILDYYLALLSVQLAVLGFVIAGIVALIQIINAAKPRRETRLLVRRRMVVGYIGYLTSVLIGLGLASWSQAFHSESMADFFALPIVGVALLILCVLGLFWFTYLTYKARRLLEAEQYLEHYISRVRIGVIRDYLFRIYAVRPQAIQPDLDLTDPGKRAEQQESAAGRDREIAVYERRYQATKDLADPFQPIREYTKDNAFKYYDFGTARGLRYFDKLFNKTLAQVTKNPKSDELFYLARYLAENTEELFGLFQKTSSEKRRIGTIRLLGEHANDFINTGSSEGFLTIIRGLEALAGQSDDTEEIILCLDYIRESLDSYLAQHNRADWSEVGNIFEEVCLSVTRLAERYYLRRDSQLETLPVSNQLGGEYRTVTSVLVDFFTQYRQLADQYKQAFPVRYFEAVEAVLEVLLLRYAEVVEQGKGFRGMNRLYQILIQRLYNIYKEVGIDAVEHKQADLLALCLSNLRRIIKPAKELGLAYERQQLTNAIVELSIRGVTELGDVIIKSDNRTIIAYAVQTLKKHANASLVAEALEQVVKEPGIDLRLKAAKQVTAALRAVK